MNTAPWPSSGEAMAPPRWIDIGRLDDIPRRGARRVIPASGTPAIAVFRTADDGVFALFDRCPHRGGPLSEGIVQGRAVACPLHGWVIGLENGRAEAPDQGCVPTVAVKQVGDRVLISATMLEAAVELRWEPA